MQPWKHTIANRWDLYDWVVAQLMSLESDRERRYALQFEFEGSNRTESGRAWLRHYSPRVYRSGFEAHRVSLAPSFARELADAWPL